MELASVAREARLRHVKPCQRIEAGATQGNMIGEWRYLDSADQGGWPKYGGYETQGPKDDIRLWHSGDTEHGVDVGADES